MPPELMTVHDIMLAGGNAAFDAARDAANKLADEFDEGRYPGLTPADALRLLAASLPRRAEVDTHKDAPDAG